MPYIGEDKKRALAYYEDKFPRNAGELNYVLTKSVHRYISAKCASNGRMSYQLYNDAIGALEGCKLELYRRFIAPYENEKIQEKGDVNGITE